MVNPVIKRCDNCTEYYFSEGCHIIETSNSDDDPELSIARARVEPGVTTKWHRLDGFTERYVIVSGAARVEIAMLDPVNVASGDVVIIPPGERQRLTNTGNEDLIFLAICSPRFVESAYNEIVA